MKKFGLFFVGYFKRSVLGFWALWVIFLVVLWSYFGMVMRARVFLDFWVNAGFFEFALLGSTRLFNELAVWFVKEHLYIQINLYVYYLMMKVMKKDALVSMVVWLILVVHPLKLICANMEGLWGPTILFFSYFWGLSLFYFVRWVPKKRWNFLC